MLRSHDQEPPDAAAAEAPATQPVAAALQQLNPGSILALQRSAGNAAVVGILRARGAVTIQRCACGGIPTGGGECEECRRRRLGGSALNRKLLRSQTQSGPPAGAVDAVVAGVTAESVSDVAAALRGNGVDSIRAIRSAVNGRIGRNLEMWLAERADWPGGEEALRLLWPVLPLIDRLLVYDAGWREIEQAQIDVIRAASVEQRTAARSDPRLEGIFGRMEAKEEFEARSLINPTPEGRYAAAERLLTRAPGVFSDEEDAVFDAIWALSPSRRRAFYTANLAALTSLLSTDRLALLRTLSEGTEAQALVARLREATEGRSDDMAAVQRVVDRAVELLREKKTLQASIASGAVSGPARAEAEARVAEMGDLEALLQFDRNAAGELAADSFMGRLAAARGDAGAFAADAQRLGGTLGGADARRHALETAKQRILMADGDRETIKAAIVGLHAPQEAPVAGAGVDSAPDTEAAARSKQAADEQLRRELLADPAVAAVIAGLTGFDRMLVEGAVTADAFDEVLGRLADALNSARWGDFFRILVTISRNDDWLARFRATAPDPTSVYARTHREQRAIMERILELRRPPLDLILAFTGDVETLKAAFADVGEDERARLRLGATLALDPPVGPPTEAQAAALAAYRDLEQRLTRSQTTLGVNFDRAGFHKVLWTILGSEPTMEELRTGEGRWQAAELMYQQQQSQLRLERGAAAGFSETDETMVAAAREFAARFEPVRQSRTLTTVDFAVLSALHDRFQHRSSEFDDASNAVGEIAGVVAATVAGAIVVAATGGVATPGVIAAAAAAGGTARIVTQEMFGADFYDPSARDAMMGALDGALAVVGGSLAQRGAQMIGLGGRVLVGTAARAGAEVAASASASLSRRVASGAVQAAIDGAFSGAVSEAFGRLTDPATWRRGIWQGLMRVGEAALAAGLTGLATGGVVGGGLPLAGAAGRRLLGSAAERAIEDTLVRAGARETLDAARAAARAGDATELERLLATLEAHLTPEQATTLRARLQDELADAVSHLPGPGAAAGDARAAVLHEAPATVGRGSHTLKAIRAGERVQLWLCTDCTVLIDRVKGVLASLPETAKDLRPKLEAILASAEKFEADFVAKKIAEPRLVRETSALAGRLTELSGLHPDIEGLLFFRTFLPGAEQARALLGDALATRLQKELGEEAFVDLVRRIGPDAVRGLSDLPGPEIRALITRMQAQVGDEANFFVRWLGEGMTGAQANQILTELPPAILLEFSKGRAKIGSGDVLRAVAELGAQAIQDVRRVVGGKLTGGRLMELVNWQMFTLEPKLDARLVAGQGAIVRKLPPMRMRALADIEVDLAAAGMTGPIVERSQRIWTAADGSVVRIKLNPSAARGGFPELVREISDVPGGYGKNDIIAKITESGTVLSAGTGWAKDALTGWWRQITGIAHPTPIPAGDLAVLLDVWAAAGHIPYTP